MQREIKFRVWMKEENCFFESTAYEFTLKGKGKIHSFEDGENIIISQYTGIKDGNGKELFEGDLIDYKDYMFLESPYPIIFHNGFFGIKHKIDMCIYPIDPEYYFEIIGNIYENSELLESPQ